MKCNYCGGEPHAIGVCPMCQDLEATRRLLTSAQVEVAALREALTAEEAWRNEADQDKCDQLRAYASALRVAALAGKEHKPC